MKRLGFAALVPLLGCSGLIGDTSGVTPPADQGRPLAVPFALDTLARRLTASEVDATLEDLLGEDTRPARALFPEDSPAPRNPFANDYTTQLGSAALVEAAAFVAADVAERFVADPNRVRAYLPCVPAGRGDSACMRRFVENFGRRALRRPLTGEEVDRYLGLMQIANEDYETFTPTFNDTLALVIEAFLQDFEFLYRVEVGEPAEGGAATLGDFEIAARMAFFLWGRGPDDAWTTPKPGGCATPQAVPRWPGECSPTRARSSSSTASMLNGSAMTAWPSRKTWWKQCVSRPRLC